MTLIAYQRPDLGFAGPPDPEVEIGNLAAHEAAHDVISSRDITRGTQTTIRVSIALTSTSPPERPDYLFANDFLVRARRLAAWSEYIL